MSEALARLREILSETPSAHAWWEAVAWVQEDEELQHYLLHKVQDSEQWRRCSVPSGAWDKDHPGHKLSSVAVQELPLLPHASLHFCPPGTYRLGSRKTVVGAQENHEVQRSVALTRGFWALTTPVTQAMFTGLMNSNPSQFSGELRPVDSVSWVDAVHFCNSLSEQAGLQPAYVWREGQAHWEQDASGFRLPTEAEWEVLCRAGSLEPTYGPLEEIAWFGDNSGDETAEVGGKQANAWGLFDTLGNVQEWCFDSWQENPDDPDTSVDPVFASETTELRVHRGGTCFDFARFVHACSRNSDAAEAPFSLTGFRIVRNDG